MNPAVELKGVSKRFSKSVYPFPSWEKKKKIQALTHVSLQVPAGSIFALVGPNGSGKTTLLKILGGLLLPDEGEVLIHGSFFKGDDTHLQRQVALASSVGRDFYRRLTVRQNLEFFSVLYDLPPKKIRQSILQMSHQLGLEGALDRPYEQLSSGVRQKLVLARALLNQASILLLDEPTRSLDPLARREFRNFLKGFSKKFEKTLVFATHDLSEAEELADTIGILHEGRLLKIGALREFIGDNGREKERKGLEDAFVALCQKSQQ